MLKKEIFFGLIVSITLMAGFNIFLVNQNIFHQFSLNQEETHAILIRKSEWNENWTQLENIGDNLYNLAANETSDTSMDTAKSTWDLESWNRGSGGLDDEDRKTLYSVFRNVSSVFEYGLGESTYIAAAVGLSRYAGVDSDAVWVSQARDRVHSVYSRLHFRFHFLDIGRTREWGYPVSDLNKNLFDYQIAPLIMERQPFDFYYVDGRYRVACAGVCFLHAMKYKADMSSVIVGIHDNDQGRGYDIMSKIADIILQEKRLWLYKLKKETTEKDLYDMWIWEILSCSSN